MWCIESYRSENGVYQPFRLRGLPYNVDRKRDIIDLLSKSVQFKIAYTELK